VRIDKHGSSFRNKDAEYSGLKACLPHHFLGFKRKNDSFLWVSCGSLRIFAMISHWTKKPDRLIKKQCADLYFS